MEDKIVIVDEIKELIENGFTHVDSIYEELLKRGIVTTWGYVKNCKHRLETQKRIESGANIPNIQKPYAVSGITDNPILNEYLSNTESYTGGYLKTAVYDIETTSLRADFGYVLTCTIKDIDEGELKVYRLDETGWYKDAQTKWMKGQKSNWNNPDFWDVVDVELLQFIQKELSKYDMVITYNGKWFDERFLQTRLLRCQLPGLPKSTQHMDVYQVAKRVLNTGSKKLDAVKNFFKIDDKQDTHEWAQWRMAQAGIKEGFDYIVEHNIKDVEQLHQVAQRLKGHTRGFLF